MILAASTGIIGRPLPFERIEDKLDILIQGLARGRSADTGAAQAIMTTDTRMKQAGMSASMGGHIVSIGGMAKGSGMISPGLATMLVFITTDAVIQGKWLGAALKEAVEGSFDCIDVDAEMSTNDSVFFLANGKADNPPLRQGTREAEFFKEGLKHVAKVLAQMIIQDAEGATKMIEITIKGARSFQEARYLAKRLSRSFLFKTAMFGNLPNWGRVLSAMGDAGVDVEEKSLDITLAKQRVFRRGEPVRFDEDKLKQQLKKRNIKVEIDIHRGGDSCTVLTSDLSVEYVRINAGYS
jgi:glutamate N-acetyltransferase/amino-acid N-acetyltransferase